MTIVTIHQPDFMPWLGFYNRLAESDVFIVLDDAQFLRRGWMHRNRIKTAQGVQWLTVPVKKKGRYQEAVNAVEISDASDWADGHLRTLETNYRPAPHFDCYFPDLEKLFSAPHDKLVDLNLSIHERVMEFLGLEVKTLKASEMNIEGGGTRRLVDLVQTAGGTAYLSGLGAMDYLEEELFRDAGLDLIWQDFPLTVYPQQFPDLGFAENLTAMDCLFNCGDDAVGFLRPGGDAPAQKIRVSG